jgi:hypothetical protein
LFGIFEGPLTVRCSSQDVIALLHIRIRVAEVLVCSGKKMGQNSIEQMMKIFITANQNEKLECCPLQEIQYDCGLYARTWWKSMAWMMRKKKTVQDKFKVHFPLFKDRNSCVAFHWKWDLK